MALQLLTAPTRSSAPPLGGAVVLAFLVHLGTNEVRPPSTTHDVSANNLYQYLLCCRRGGHKSHACYACHFSIVAVTLQKKCARGRQEPTCCGRKKPLATWGIERNSVVLTLTSVQPQSQQEPKISCSLGFIPTYTARFCVDERATVLLIRYTPLISPSPQDDEALEKGEIYSAVRLFFCVSYPCVCRRQALTVWEAPLLRAFLPHDREKTPHTPLCPLPFPSAQLDSHVSSGHPGSLCRRCLWNKR
ncbi:unnamed protein product [Rangifer tarandus platyrhynchus]|uniref:Uncharacterized protein n=2 Tax=Rangifer tarandus platyrhynchus TaxID=3082113 RepID=A0ABN8YWY4_RANTA|nr:unnamed protein product [Rangifer tarandus platyrhynchus]CAI9702042.1 unnamed protein product [Rangifer tarandus platyrhynchus]